MDLSQSLYALTGLFHVDLLSAVREKKSFKIMNDSLNVLQFIITL